MIDWLMALWPQHWMRPWWLLALVPALLLFYGLWRSRHNQSQWQQLIDPGLLKHLLHNPVNARSLRNRAWPIVMAALASCIGIVALAGPAWEKLPQPPQRTQHTLVLIADLTLSMHTQDIAPSRLTRMRYKLLELLSRRKEGQTALIAYSGDAHLVSPLTDDAATIAALVPALSPEIMPSIGSNASAAFTLADTMLQGIAGAKRIVWFTDEVLPRDRDTIRSVVARHDVELLVIGIGTAAGGPVPLPSGKFLKDRRQTIVTARLDTAALRSLASEAGAAYIALRADNSDVELALSQRSLRQRMAIAGEAPPGASAADRTLRFDIWADRGASLCLLLLPVALLAFRRGTVLSCLCLVVFSAAAIQPMQVSASDAEGGTALQDKPAASPSGANPAAAVNLFRTPDQRAQRLLQNKQYSAAAETFERNDWRGVAAFHGQQYSQAQQAFEQNLAALQASPGAPEKLARAHYNAGHASAYNGELQAAIDHYQRALELDPAFSDAATAKILLEQLLQQQEQQEQQEQQQENQAQQDQQQAQNDQQRDSQGAGQQNQSQQNPGQQNPGQQQSKQQQTDTAAKQNQPGSNGQGSRQADLDSTAHDATTADEEDRDKEGHAMQAQQRSEKQQRREEQQRRETAGEQDARQAARAQDLQQQASAGATAGNSPEQMRLQRWLNQIEDDPGGLLRRKFQYQRQMRERERNVVDSSADGQLW